MRNIDKRFMGAHALAAAALEVEPAEVMGLVGQNGAGKSTLIKVLTGAHRKDAGEIVFGGETIEFASPLAAQHGGISTIYQEINLIPYRSVAENIFLGREFRRFGLLDWRRMNRDAAAIAAPLRRRDRRAPPVDGIQHRDPANGGDRARRVVQGAPGDHGRADVVARRARGRGSVRRHPAVARRGRLGDLHHPSTGRALSDLRPGDGDARRPHGDDQPDGRRRQTAPHRGDARARSRSGARARDWIPGDLGSGGRRGARGGRAGRRQKGPRRAPRGARWTDRRTRRPAGIGPNRGGARDFRRRSARRRRHSTDGKRRFSTANPPRRSRSASASAPRIARWRASFPTCRSARTSRSRCCRGSPALGVVDEPRQRAVVDRFVARLAIKTANIDQKVRELSGGNQQKVLLARWLCTDPKLLILDEPTRGIDVGAKVEIQTADQGTRRPGSRRADDFIGARGDCRRR